MATWKDVVKIGTRLPEVEETKWWGTPALKVRGKGMCRLRTDPDALVLRVLDVEDQQALIKGNPDVFFITAHYKNWPYLLVRLEAIDRRELDELIEDAWRVMAPVKLVKAYDAGSA